MKSLQAEYVIVMKEGQGAREIAKNRKLGRIGHRAESEIDFVHPVTRPSRSNNPHISFHAELNLPPT